MLPGWKKGYLLTLKFLNQSRCGKFIVCSLLKCLQEMAAGKQWVFAGKKLNMRYLPVNKFPDEDRIFIYP
jgi:hypothetical protein